MAKTPLDKIFDEQSNLLLLNPRLPAAPRQYFKQAWQELVEPHYPQRGLIGLTTSGTSKIGHGTLIILERSALRVSAQAVNQLLQSTADDIWFNPLPLFHVGGLGIHLRAQLSQAQVINYHSAKWNPEKFLCELTTSRASLLSLVPTQLFDLLQRNYRSPQSLRAVVVGGGRLEPSLYLAARRNGWPVLPSYGLTECCSQVATAQLPSLISDDYAYPALYPLSHVKLKIDEDGQLQLASAALLVARIEEQDGQILLIDPKEQGWFKTSDHAKIEADGALTILGRDQDFVKICGENIVLGQLNALLVDLRLRLAIATDLVLVPLAAPREGAQIVLLVEDQAAQYQAASNAVADLPSSSILRQLIEEFNAQVLPLARVRQIFFVPKLPRNSLGKLIIGQALKMCAGGQSRDKCPNK